MSQLGGSLPDSEQSGQGVPKLLLLGDASVGKSSLLLRFTEEDFDPHLLSSNGIDFRLKTIGVPGFFIVFVGSDLCVSVW